MEQPQAERLPKLPGILRAGPNKSLEVTAPVSKETFGIGKHNIPQTHIISRFVPPTAVIGIAIHRQPNILGLLAVQGLARINHIDQQLRQRSHKPAQHKPTDGAPRDKRGQTLPPGT